jgi:hypothetical protein
MRSLQPDRAVDFFALTSQCEGIERSLQLDCAVASGASERHSGNSVQGSSALPAEGLGLLKKRFGE